MTADFISTYADYADVLEAPRILHELVGIQIVAAALNRNGVSFHNGVVHYSLDLWMLLLSGSGSGRSTMMSLVAPILERAGMEDLERPVRWGSASGFFQHFAENACGLFVWGEMAEQLKMLNDPKFAGVKEWLTDRFDSFRVPSAHRYRRTGKKDDTPAIEFTAPPRTNILATSNSDWFYRNLTQEDSTGGYLARWITVRADGDGRDVPIPRAPDDALVGPLADRLGEISQLTGEADLSSVMSLYSSWYCNAKRRFEAQANRALAMAYWNRHRGNVLKLAVIFEAARSATLKVSVASWVRAVKFTAQIEQNIFRMLPTGMSAAGFELQRMEERIRQGGPDGLSRNDLTRAFQSMPARQRDEHIKTLVNAGKISFVSLPTAGRPKEVYLHLDFRQETL